MSEPNKTKQPSLPTPGGILYETERDRIFGEICSLISNLDEIETKMRTAFAELKREMKRLNEKIDEIRYVI